MSVMAAPAWRAHSPLPGFPLAFGFTVFYLGLIVILPLAALACRPLTLGVGGALAIVTQPMVQAALRLSFGAAFLAAGANVIMGLAVAWALSRYEFPGRRLVDALVDLPFALPTAVAGIALATLWGPNGWFGKILDPLGIKIAFTPAAVFVALLAVGLPFVVRSLQPVLEDFDLACEEAAVTLGAGAFTVWRRVMMPALGPALIGGFALAFARGAGEYGSVIFVAGNMPMVSQIAPLVIVSKLEAYDYAGAAAVGVAMIVISLIVLIGAGAAQLALARRGRP